jgi:adenylate cyclase class 1
VEHANNLNSTISLELEYFQILKTKTGRLSARKIEGDFTQHQNQYFSLQVIGDLSGKPGSIYSLYCDGTEFSSLEYGESVMTEVVKHVVSHRKDGARYPIYITDLEISRELIANENVNNLQIIHYLNYKKLIESKLNQALKNLK